MHNTQAADFQLNYWGDPTGPFDNNTKVNGANDSLGLANLVSLANPVTDFVDWSNPQPTMQTFLADLEWDRILVSDDSWKSWDQEVSGWNAVEFDDSNWRDSQAPNDNAPDMEPSTIPGLESTTAQWMWDSEAAKLGETGSAWFRKTLLLFQTPIEAQAVITADDQYQLYINGALAGSGNGYETAETYDIQSYLITGVNAIAIKATDSASSKEGLIVDIKITFEETSTNPVISVTPDSLDFGGQDLGSSTDLSFTVKNTGDGTLSGAATVPAPFSIVSGGTYNLGQSESQQVVVRYHPTAAGSHSAAVTFTGGAGATRPVSGFSPKSVPTDTPVPTTPPSNPTPTPTPAPSAEADVVVYDNPGDTDDLTGATDLDPIDNRNLTIHCKGSQTGATNWHVYIRKGFGGMKFLGQTGAGDDVSFDWYPSAPLVNKEFANGPDFNSVYSFRMIRLDGSLGPDDFYDMTGAVGFNLEGGNTISVAQPEAPYIKEKKVIIFDDLLGADDLAPDGGIGSDTDRAEWRAIQIVWNFDINPSSVNEYHIYVSVDGGEFTMLGQTLTGKLNYFWWTPNQEFKTNEAFRGGPEGGHTYQFKIFLIPINRADGVMKMLSGRLMYQVEE